MPTNTQGNGLASGGEVRMAILLFMTIVGIGEVTGNEGRRPALTRPIL